MRSKLANEALEVCSCGVRVNKFQECPVSTRASQGGSQWTSTYSVLPSITFSCTCPPENRFCTAVAKVPDTSQSRVHTSEPHQMDSTVGKFIVTRKAFTNAARLGQAWSQGEGGAASVGIVSQSLKAAFRLCRRSWKAL